MGKIRVLVIDDSPFNRRVLSEMLRKSPDMEVAGLASDGLQGLKRALELKPDVITLDLEMPVMDGFTFLRLLMVKRPTPVIIISAKKEDHNVFKALDLGAVDFLSKPTARISSELATIENQFISRVRSVAGAKIRMPAPAIKCAEDDALELSGRHREEIKRRPFEVLVIGASTGGPPALQSLFTSLPADLPLAIAVSQHMPPGFTRAFANRLDRLSPFEVKEACQGDALQKGRILMAPGGHHMKFRKDAGQVTADITRRSPEEIYAPSIDRMFASAAEIFEERVIGVVLTGMGSDGKEGVQAIKRARGHVIAESEESAVIYGMPKEAVQTGVVDEILPLASIVPAVVRRCRN